ncbi:MAG: DUF2892 domain-containing protein [Acidobacteriota bacterium]|nr:DUF2892 domain-containing protein [Acidobacteriota bacterium]
MEIAGKPYIVPNVSKTERAASVMGGTLLAYLGAKRRDAWGVGLAIVGAGLVRIGVTGYCYTYQYLGIRTAETGQGRNVSIPYELGVKIERAISINKARSEVYTFWRNLENLPVFMKHLKSVRVLDSKRSHWVANAPAGRTVEWDAEIISEQPDELIGWRSLPGSTVQNAGSVRFADAAGNRGTEVRVSLQYNPPGGVVGAWVAKIFGEEPERQIAEDLGRLKAMIESGQVPTNAGQTSGREQEREVKKAQKRSDEDSVRQASEESFPASDAPAYR